MRGGKVVASGTYGCILNPQVPCEGTTKRQNNMVSKLMTRKNAEDEINEIRDLRKVIKKVKNDSNYFVLGNINMCTPTTLDDEDFKDFDSKCTAMRKEGIYKRNINSLKKELRILQLPDGGLDISTYFGKSFDMNTFLSINNSLKELLVKGVVKMNQNNILHMDIKSANIVYSEHDKRARLIDWGLSKIIKTSVKENDISWFPIMFNQPFYNIVFNETIQYAFNTVFLDKFVKDYKSGVDYQNNSGKIRMKSHFSFGRIIVSDLKKDLRALFKQIMPSIKNIERVIGQIGHVAVLIDYIKTIAKSNINKDFEYGSLRGHYSDNDVFFIFRDLVIDQLVDILIKYSVNNEDNSIGPFREDDYFNEIYKHNCDVFGLISTYIDITNSNKYNKAPLKLQKDIYELLIEKYYLSPDYAIKKLPISNIAQSLTEIGRRNGFKKSIKTCPPGLVLDVKTNTCKRKSSKRKVSHKSKKCPSGKRRNKKTGKCVAFK